MRPIVGFTPEPSSRSRRLFLQWLFVNTLALVLAAAGLVAVHARIKGASFYAIPLILLVFATGSAYGGRLCWRAGSIDQGYGVSFRWDREAILHDALWLPFVAWVCQLLGICSTVVGFWIILTGDTSDLSAKIQSGGGVALLGTFVGVVASKIIAWQERLLEHSLKR